MHNYILLHSYALLDSNAIPILSLTPYEWLFTANLRIPNVAGNVIPQQLAYAQHVLFTNLSYNAIVLESQLMLHY